MMCNMNTGQRAEQYIKDYFQKKGVELIKKSRSEHGYDFRDKDSKIFIEVKGTTAKNITDALFRYFTNTEYEKARSCRKAKQDYQIHLVTGIGSNNIKHYKIPGEELLDKGRPEVSWWLPLKKDFRKYELP